ncbi:MAG: four helix bundle protein [Prolixibacteraceae bacterium]|nr:four helix bundle protein [Prolixibacteraceae bacterium]
MNSFREIKVWQKSMDFVTKLYKTTRIFPQEELYGLTSQLRRSAISIPSNIAEGFGRKSPAEFKRFLQISKGSLFELQTQIEISKNLNFLEQKKYVELYNDLKEIEAMLTAFIKSIK